MEHESLSLDSAQSGKGVEGSNAPVEASTVSSVSTATPQASIMPVPELDMGASQTVRGTEGEALPGMMDAGRRLAASAMYRKFSS